MGSGRQLHLELLDERSHILVGNDGTLVLLDAKDAFVDMNLEVALDLALTTQAPALLDFLTREVRLLRVENLAPTLKHLHLALSARGLTATSTGQEDTVLVKGGHEAVTLCNRDGTVAIDFDIHVA